MEYLYAFLFAGVVCLIGQVILDNSNLTPGHVNTLFVIIGVIAEMFGLYTLAVNNFGAGASVLITNFGYMLYDGAYQGFLDNGLLGLFTGVLIKSSLGLAFTIFIAFIIGLLFKPRN